MATRKNAEKLLMEQSMTSRLILTLMLAYKKYSHALTLIKYSVDNINVVWLYSYIEQSIMDRLVAYTNNFIKQDVNDSVAAVFMFVGPKPRNEYLCICFFNISCFREFIY